MVTADQLVAHLVGDYVLQSDWMANEKTKKDVAAFCHALVYTLCFVPLLPDFHSPNWALIVILVTHFLIDRYRLARYVCYAKNFLAPKYTYANMDDWATKTKTVWWHPWSECVGTGYHKDRPPWMSVWLMIIADNTMHILINAIALTYL